MPEQHIILGGKVHVYKRPNSSLWQCSSYFAGKNRRTSTKEESLSKAKEIAEDWYLIRWLIIPQWRSDTCASYLTIGPSQFYYENSCAAISRPHLKRSGASGKKTARSGLANVSVHRI
jgi:hypothetical protein